MHIRLAKPCDINQLAYVHWVCSAKQAGGFMYKMGKSFLAQYYRISMKEKHSLILVAEDEQGKLVGFHSGTLRAEEHMAMLRRSRLSLFIASVPALLRNPRLIRDAFDRQRSGSADAADSGYVVTSGPRGEYWAWLPGQRNPGGAIELHQTWHAFMRLLGAKTVRSEIDISNSRILKFAHLLGARVVKEFVTPAGNKRMILEYKLDEYGSAKKPLPNGLDLDAQE